MAVRFRGIQQVAFRADITRQRHDHIFANRIDSRVRNLIVAKAPGAEESSGALLNQMQNWIGEWDRVMKPFQDAKGNLKPEFKGYISTRKRVSKLINELSKARELEAKAKSNP